MAKNIDDRLIGRTLKTFRCKRNVSQEELADRIEPQFFGTAPGSCKFLSPSSTIKKPLMDCCTLPSEYEMIRLEKIYSA